MLTGMKRCINCGNKIVPKTKQNSATLKPMLDLFCSGKCKGDYAGKVNGIAKQM